MPIPPHSPNLAGIPLRRCRLRGRQQKVFQLVGHIVFGRDNVEEVFDDTQTKKNFLLIYGYRNPRFSHISH